MGRLTKKRQSPMADCGQAPVSEWFRELILPGLWRAPASPAPSSPALQLAGEVLKALDQPLLLGLQALASGVVQVGAPAGSRHLCQGGSSGFHLHP